MYVIAPTFICSFVFSIHRHISIWVLQGTRGDFYHPVLQHGGDHISGNRCKLSECFGICDVMYATFQHGTLPAGSSLC